MAFANAKSMTPKTSPAKKGKEKEVVELANVKQLANLTALQKAITGAIKALEGTMKEDAMDNFLDTAVRTGAKPDSVDAIEDDARINVQFKKRTTLSAFSVEEIRNMATALGVPHDHIETGDHQEADLLVQLIKEKTDITIPVNVKVQQLYAIDPEVALDAVKMKKVEDVLKRNGLDDIIVLQEEVKTYIATDELMAIACSKKNADLIRPLATIGFKPTLSEVDPKQLLKTAGEVLDVAIKFDFDEKKIEEVAKTNAKAASAKAKAKKTAALEKA